MPHTLDAEARDLLFHKARTYTAWLDQPVSDDTLRELYNLMKWGPTSANTTPARILFLRTKEAKERLKPALAPGNVGKTMAAPVTAIVGYDSKFYEHLPRLFPQMPAMSEMFVMEQARQTLPAYAAAAFFSSRPAFCGKALIGDGW